MCWIEHEYNELRTALNLAGRTLYMLKPWFVHQNQTLIPFESLQMPKLRTCSARNRPNNPNSAEFWKNPPSELSKNTKLRNQDLGSTQHYFWFVWLFLFRFFPYKFFLQSFLSVRKPIHTSLILWWLCMYFPFVLKLGIFFFNALIFFLSISTMTIPISLIRRIFAIKKWSCSLQPFHFTALHYKSRILGDSMK